MRDYIEIGPTPINEDCVQIGVSNYSRKATKEASIFVDQLRRQFGPEPIGTSLSIKWFSHDFGAYVSVVCYYDQDSEESVNYAFSCEGLAWEKWDDQSRLELVNQ
ncbi:hypothetical protein PN437_20150 [Microcystis aeruginosa CS-564/01]|uniref:hypothetical protein n=1 Tax=Microcystis aeruginosa TaxID=1126 RepID=UPI00232A8642|nr:hypothetical protein [Microcystis aeruginosa]MDB9427178.1 hypothetical protein [Microcystis aeruginosa CS-564/01]